MIQLVVLMVTAMLIVTVFIFHRDVAAPAFLLVVTIWISMVFNWAFNTTYQFSNIEFAKVLGVGVGAFVLAAYLTALIDSRGRRPSIYPLKAISIPSMQLIVYLVFQLLLFGMILLMIHRTTGGSLGLSSLSKTVGAYYELARTGSKAGSSIVSIGQILNFSGIYYLLFVYANNKLHGMHNSRLLIFNILIGVAGSLLTGTKTTFFMYIITVFIYFTVIRSKLFGWKKSINIRAVFIAGFLFILLVFLFNFLNEFQGRTLQDMNSFEVLSSYLGAPMKNLELFLGEGHLHQNLFGAQTFSSTYSRVYDFTKNSYFQVASYYQYRWWNGVGLGNVYTLFMPLYADFGLAGVGGMMAFLGMFCQAIYDHIKFTSSPRVTYFIMFYGYLAFSIMFSFFSNKFFESIFSMEGIYFIVGIGVFDLYFRRLSFRTTQHIQSLR
ncbi:O-antigen polymerase [Lacticaseibacillus porcinae]|uniref:O-antigen polymerase n=1 Tax=Lacticaseibacillus porcinae TaxID=1123687 RepID=UPI000F7B2496|nr:O-antigen polymerase [Lacticaseibacillus porcinae]